MKRVAGNFLIGLSYKQMKILLILFVGVHILMAMVMALAVRA